MSVKERFKALVFVVSLLAIGHVGNFHSFLFENADAHGGRIRQWTTTHTVTRTVGREDAGTVVGTCSHCGSFVTGRKYYRLLQDFTFTTCYFDDGHEVYWENCGITSGSVRRGSAFYKWKDHNCSPATYN